MTTKPILPLFVAMLLVACVLTGCQSPKAESTSGSTAAQATRNNCYSLLHQLLEEQKDVSVLRFIKSEHSDVKNLIKKIAAASGAGSQMLEEFAKHDPSLHLNDIQLPPGEESTRDAIASTKKKELLGQTGDEFELTLLLTQTEALNYAWHLGEGCRRKRFSTGSRPCAGRRRHRYGEPLPRNVRHVALEGKMRCDELE